MNSWHILCVIEFRHRLVGNIFNDLIAYHRSCVVGGATCAEAAVSSDLLGTDKQGEKTTNSLPNSALTPGIYIVYICRICNHNW